MQAKRESAFGRLSHAISLLRLICGVGLLVCGVMTVGAAPRKIVLIAGPLDSHAPGTHEYENNIVLLKHCLENSPNLPAVKCELHFNGWPQNPAKLNDADTIVLTSGGSDRNETDHPLYVGDRLDQLAQQMKRGCGLVLIHWSTFHPSRVEEKILDFAGGYFDYETGNGGPTKTWYSRIENHAWTTVIAAPTHPVCFGVNPFTVTEEFYFNLRFRPGDSRLSHLVLNGLPGQEPENTVAWALQRENGGRSFGTTGGHYYTNWWNADFRKLVVNAIVWTANLDVPPAGAETSLERFPDLELHKPISEQEKELKSSKPSRPGAKRIRPANPEDDVVKEAKEEAWRDNRWNETDHGQFLSSLVSAPNGTVLKGLSVRVGEGNEGAVCYDTFLCNVRAAWTGKFLEFDPMRFGLINTPKIGGEVQFLSPAGAAWNGTPTYRGLYLNGKRVVISYQLGDVPILESPWLEGSGETKVFSRTFELGPSQPMQFLFLADAPGCPATNVIDGIEFIRVEEKGTCLAAAVVPQGAGSSGPVAAIGVANGQLNLQFESRSETRACKVLVWSGSVTNLPQFAAVVKESRPPESLRDLIKGAQPRWTEPVETKGSIAPPSAEPYVVDTLSVPYDNPHKALMFLSGVDFMVNGDAAVCSIHGDVWMVSGINEKLDRLQWKRFATGLFQPLGLRVVKNQVYVLGRDQITRLHDRNGDGEADYFENFCNKIKTSVGGHDYVTALEVDSAGNFYYIDPSGLHRVSRDGKQHETVAKGWRNPNGMGVGPQGVITAAPQEGTWTPSSAIFEVKPGGYYGFGGPQVTEARPLGYDPPLCWIPRAIDNSTGSQVWVRGNRWGPLEGQMLSLSFGRCAMMLVLRETVGGVSQGGVVSLKPRFLSGAMRGTYRPQDGQLYVVGSHGWQTSATRDGCFQRVRYTGANVYLPTALHVRADGIQLTFSQPLDRETAEDAGSYGIEQWNYRYAKEYGSKEYSLASPEKVGHDEVEVRNAKLLPDGRSVFLTINDLQPVMQMKIQFNVNAGDGKAIRGEIYNTINQVGSSQPVQ